MYVDKLQRRYNDQIDELPSDQNRLNTDQDLITERNNTDESNWNAIPEHINYNRSNDDFVYDNRRNQLVHNAENNYLDRFTNQLTLPTIHEVKEFSSGNIETHQQFNAIITEKKSNDSDQKNELNTEQNTQTQTKITEESKIKVLDKYDIIEKKLKYFYYEIIVMYFFYICYNQLVYLISVDSDYF